MLEDSKRHHWFTVRSPLFSNESKSEIGGCENFSKLREKCFARRPGSRRKYMG